VLQPTCNQIGARIIADSCLRAARLRLPYSADCGRRPANSQAPRSHRARWMGLGPAQVAVPAAIAMAPAAGGPSVKDKLPQRWGRGPPRTVAPTRPWAATKAATESALGEGAEAALATAEAALQCRLRSCGVAPASTQRPTTTPLSLGTSHGHGARETIILQQRPGRPQCVDEQRLVQSRGVARVTPELGGQPSVASCPCTRLFCVARRSG
jgi:hypothetical protein